MARAYYLFLQTTWYFTQAWFVPARYQAANGMSCISSSAGSTRRSRDSDEEYEHTGGISGLPGWCLFYVWWFPELVAFSFAV